jgi:HEPN domain-containing protein
MYEGRGTLERLQGDTMSAARSWLQEASNELDGIPGLIEGGSYRLAYNAAYDIMRHAAEAVLEKAGGRVTATPGAHEAVFALADALVDEDAPGVFAGTRANVSRLKRHSLEYISDSPASVDEKDAREALQWATECISAAGAFIKNPSSPTI